jgi:glutamate synthase (NADPH/NADH) large chain
MGAMAARDGVAPSTAMSKFQKAVSFGILKVMSKMGISTVQSYKGAQIFEAVGINRALVDLHFAGTPSRIGGVGLLELGVEAGQRHAIGFGAAAALLAFRFGSVRHQQSDAERARF